MFKEAIINVNNCASDPDNNSRNGA